MNPAVTAPPPSPAPRATPLLARINLRLIVFTGVVLLLIGFPVYVYVESAVTGGIKDIGNGFKQVDLKAMSNFPFDQANGTRDDIPAKWRQLDGQKVVVYGELWNSLDASDGRMHSFELCYSIAKCCFNGPPQVQHFVKATVVPGRNVYYAPNLVKVTGTLHVDVKKDPEAGKVTQVYRMDVEDVEPST
jgi:hypothetical protein